MLFYFFCLLQAGVSGLSDISEGLNSNHFDQKLLQTMSISKLQFIANELHSKIESKTNDTIEFCFYGLVESERVVLHKEVEQEKLFFQ